MATKNEKQEHCEEDLNVYLSQLFSYLLTLEHCMFNLFLFSAPVSVCLVSELPGNLGELTSKVTELPQKLAQGVGGVTEKCSLQ